MKQLQQNKKKNKKQKKLVKRLQQKENKKNKKQKNSEATSTKTTKTTNTVCRQDTNATNVGLASGYHCTVLQAVTVSQVKMGLTSAASARKKGGAGRRTATAMTVTHRIIQVFEFHIWWCKIFGNRGCEHLCV